MEGKTTPSLYGERGARGKFRKPPARKPPSKPYDRPPPAPAAQTRGWLSKIVDPACRLLADGATKILPSFFSIPASAPAALPPCNSENSDDRDSDVMPGKKGDAENASSHGAFMSSEVTGRSEVPNGLKETPDFDELVKGKEKNSDKNEISRIEQLIEEKVFSRDEINHLMQILNSKALGVSDAEQGTQKVATATAEENERVLLTHNGEQEDNNRAMLETPLPQSNVKDEIGASPIDIARAYMGSRKLGQGPGPYGDLSKVQGMVEFSSNSLILSPSSKASTCWPGAMVPDQRGHVTPLSQRGRYGLHDFPRTPYSRTIYSKTRGELVRSQADGKSPSSSSNFFMQPRTSVYGQDKTKDDVLRDGLGSVGPVRRIRNKFASEARSRVPIFSKPLTHTSSTVETPNVPNRFLLTVEKNLEPGKARSSSILAGSAERRSEEGSLLLNPSTSQAVRRILEQLDRTKPSPKEKAAELKLATAWRSPASSEISEDLMTASRGLTNTGDKKGDPSSEVNVGGRNSDAQVSSLDVANEAKNAVDARASVCSLNGDSGSKNQVSGESLSGLKNISDSHVQGSLEKAFVGITNGQRDRGDHPPLHDRSNEQKFSFLQNAPDFGQSKKPASQSTGTKPVLPSISISKRSPGRVVSSDNGLGFTFPVSASFGVSSEPPTPSIMPSSSPSLLPLPAQGSTIPSYTFGVNKSSQRLVFSFPATNSGPSDDDTSDLNFKFGSENKTRISFKSAGKGAVCY